MTKIIEWAILVCSRKYVHRRRLGNATPNSTNERCTGVYKLYYRKVFERGFIHVMAYAANTNYTTYSSRFLFSIFSPKSWSHEKKQILLHRKHKLYYIFESLSSFFLRNSDHVNKHTLYYIENTNFTTFRWLENVVKFVFAA